MARIKCAQLKPFWPLIPRFWIEDGVKPGKPAMLEFLTCICSASPI